VIHKTGSPIKSGSSSFMAHLPSIAGNTAIPWIRLRFDRNTTISLIEKTRTIANYRRETPVIPEQRPSEKRCSQPKVL